MDSTLPRSCRISPPHLQQVIVAKPDSTRLDLARIRVEANDRHGRHRFARSTLAHKAGISSLPICKDTRSTTIVPACPAGKEMEGLRS
jgi:hypothetical protein